MNMQSRSSEFKQISDMILEPRLVMIVLIDLSSSMSDDGKIIIANQVLEKIRQSLLEDPIAVKRIELSLIGFNSDTTTLQSFLPLVSFKPIEDLKTGYNTQMGTAILHAVHTGKERIRKIQRLGGNCYPLHILMISDGMPTDDIEPAINLLKQERDRRDRVVFTSIGIGDFDRNTLCSLSPHCFDLKQLNITKFIDWYSEYLRIISHSFVGEEIPCPALPEGLTRLRQEKRGS